MADEEVSAAFPAFHSLPSCSPTHSTPSSTSTQTISTTSTTSVSLQPSIPLLRLTLLFLQSVFPKSFSPPPAHEPTPPPAAPSVPLVQSRPYSAGPPPPGSIIGTYTSTIPGPVVPHAGPAGAGMDALYLGDLTWVRRRFRFLLRSGARALTETLSCLFFLAFSGRQMRISDGRASRLEWSTSNSKTLPSPNTK